MNAKEKVIYYFLDNPTSTIIEISNATGIPASTCQRYLNLKEYSNILIKKTNRTVQEQLHFNRLKGNQKGGRTTFEKYESKKSEDGKFIGLEKTDKDDKEQKKRKEIKMFVNYFSKNPHATLDEMAEAFDNLYTTDYIYDCLNDPRVEEIFGKIISNAIVLELQNNKYSFLKKYDGKLTEDIFKQSGLSPLEIQVLNYRFNSGEIHSQEEVALFFNVSKTTIEKIENSAIDKIENYNKRKKEI